MIKIAGIGLLIQSVCIWLKLASVITESWAVTLFPAYATVAFIGLLKLGKYLKSK